MRFRTLTVRVPVSDIEATRQLALREVVTHQSRVSYMLGQLSKKVIGYPACPQSEMLLDDFLQQPSRLKRYTPSCTNQSGEYEREDWYRIHDRRILGGSRP
jgi:hypothetical protein